jgi:hypothetical protein
MTDTTQVAGSENTDAAADPASSAPTAPAATGAPEANQPTGTTEGTTPPAEGTEPKAEGTAEEGAKPPEGAPEAYTDFKAPEGFNVKPEMVSEVQGLAKDLDMSQDNAQKVFDLSAKLVQQDAQAYATQVQSIKDSWTEAAKVDKEFGGEKLGENLARAKAALEATANPAFKEVLETTGLGNHPEFIRHFLKISKAYLPDTWVPGGTKPAGADKSAGQVLYPNNP